MPTVPYWPKDNEGRGSTQRAENFGRYDPVNHMLIVDRKSSVPPGYPEPPIAIAVGNKGRLHAVLTSHNDEVLEKAFKSGVPREEPVNLQHELHRRNVARPEKFGRYDPITSSLAFHKTDGTEVNVRVGDNGRLRSVFESGQVDSKEARDLGLPPPENYKGKAQYHSGKGNFNPLTHEYQSGATPRDSSKSEGRRSIREPHSRTVKPNMNPVTQSVDHHNTSSLAYSMYDPDVLPLRNPDLRILEQYKPPIVGSSKEEFMETFRSTMSQRSSLSRTPHSLNAPPYAYQRTLLSFGGSLSAR